MDKPKMEKPEDVAEALRRLEELKAQRPATPLSRKYPIDYIQSVGPFAYDVGGGQRIIRTSKTQS